MLKSLMGTSDSNYQFPGKALRKSQNVHFSLSNIESSSFTFFFLSSFISCVKLRLLLNYYLTTYLTDKEGDGGNKYIASCLLFVF